MKSMLLAAMTLGLSAAFCLSTAARADADATQAFSAGVNRGCPACGAVVASGTAAMSGQHADVLRDTYISQEAVAVSLHPAGNAMPALRSTLPMPPRSAVASEQLKAVIDWILAGAPSD